MARKSEPRYITEQADFPSRLKSLMDEKAVTQKTLAEVIGMRPQTVSLYIGGQSVPDINTLYKIAEYFDVSADWLIGRPNSIRNISPDAQIAGKYTGFSDGNLAFLHEIVEAIRKNTFATKREQVYLYAINEILSSQQFLTILGRIWDGYVIEHTRALNGLASKYPDEQEAAERMNEVKSEFNSYVYMGLTQERIVSGDVAISVLLNEAREAIVSIAKEIIKSDILEKAEAEEG